MKYWVRFDIDGMPPHYVKAEAPTLFQAVSVALTRLELRGVDTERVLWIRTVAAPCGMGSKVIIR